MTTVFIDGDDDAVEIPTEIPVSCDPSPLYDDAVTIPLNACPSAVTVPSTSNTKFNTRSSCDNSYRIYISNILISQNTSECVTTPVILLTVISGVPVKPDALVALVLFPLLFH